MEKQKLNSLKTICQGALGAMTFGIYHAITTDKMIKMNNEKQNTMIKEH